MSVQAFLQSPDQARETVHKIHGRLEKLLDSIPDDLKLGTSRRRDHSSMPRRVQSIYLHFAIYGSIMATHVIFFYPWIAGRFGTHRDTAFQKQVITSSETIANAARQILHVLPSLSADISIPAWLAFYYPMYAHINLFIYLLRHPSKPTTSRDLALLYICAGHFGTLEHLTSSAISFQFPRDSAALCSMAVKGLQRKEEGNATNPTPPQARAWVVEDISTTRGPNDTPGSNAKSTFSLIEGVVRLLMPPSSPDEADMVLKQPDPFDPMNFDMESWDIFSSIDIPDTFATDCGGVEEPSGTRY